MNAIVKVFAQALAKALVPAAALAGVLPLMLLLVALAPASGCGHTHAVGPADSPAGGGPRADEDRGHARPPEDRAARPAGTRAVHDAPPSDTVTRERTRPEIPIASTPEGLLKPGAEKKIQEKLADQGLLHEERPSGALDAPTREALRRFQRTSGLPATGFPDDATVRKLGLDPQGLFESGDQPAAAPARDGAGGSGDERH
jgi:hypothetical protein